MKKQNKLQEGKEEIPCLFYIIRSSPNFLLYKNNNAQKFAKQISRANKDADLKML